MEEKEKIEKTTVSIADVTNLRNSFEMVASLITEAEFDFSDEGLKLISMDPANVCMVVLEIKPSEFIEYSLGTKKSVGLNIINFIQVLKKCRKDETVKFIINDNIFEIQYIGKSVRKFKQPLIDIDSKEKKMPTLNFKGNFVIGSKEFKDLIDDSKYSGESVSLELSKESLIAKSRADTGSSWSEEIKPSDDFVISITDDTVEKVSSKFSTDYLEKIAKIHKLGDKLVMFLSQDYPTQIVINADGIKLTSILAPRVENS